MKRKLILVFAIILALTACGRGTSQEVETDYTISNQDIPISAPAGQATTATPANMDGFAEQHIETLIQSYDHPHIRIVDTRIDRFEKLAEFDHLIPGTVELWAFNFSIQVEYEAFIRWSGPNAMPDENGWTHSLSIFGDMVTHLVFSRIGGDVTLIGPISWNMGIGFAYPATPWNMEIIMRQFLEHENMLPPVKFSGNHYFVYARHQDDMYSRFLMSQPITQGDGGIWAIDRWQSFNIWGSHSSIFDIPQSDTLAIMEYYEELQREFDAGRLPYLGNPEDVVRAFFDETQIMDATILGVYPVDLSASNPADLPNLHGPVRMTDTEMSIRNTEWPTDFRSTWAPQYTAIREQKLEKFGGLAYNEAYHFRMDDGRYALITGWRPMLTREEFMYYYPGYDMPAQIGDFTLVGINVNDLILDAIRIYNRPMPTHASSILNFFSPDTHEPLPIGEVFTRNVWAFALYAVYVNNAGEYVSLSISPSHGANVSSLLWAMQYTRAEIDGYGEFYFAGGNNRYAAVVHKSEHAQQIIELAFIDPDIFTADSWGWLHSHDFKGVHVASEARLTELVRMFNPRALFERYHWFFVNN